MFTWFLATPLEWVNLFDYMANGDEEVEKKCVANKMEYPNFD